MKKSLLVVLILAIFSLLLFGCNKKELEELKTENENLVSEIESKDEDIASLQKQLEDLRKESEENVLSIKAEYESRIDALNFDIKTLEDSITSLGEEYEANMEALKESHEEELANLASSEESKRKALEEEYNSKVSTLTTTYESRISELEGLIEEANEDIASLEEEKENAISELTEDYESKISELNDRISELEAVTYHTVSFDSLGGEIIEPSLVAHGEKVSKPENPTREGYVFKGWTYNDEEWSFIGYVVTDDMTLYAEWEKIDTYKTDIYQIDKTKLDITSSADGKYTLPDSHFKLYGGYYDETYGFIRMPNDVAKATSGTVEELSKNTTGIRCCFSTDSNYVRFNYTIEPTLSYHIAYKGSSCFALMEIVDGGYKYCSNINVDFGTMNTSSFLECWLDQGEHDLVLFFPLCSNIKSLEVVTNAGSNIWTYKNYYRDELPILYYGSSITHGYCASRSDNTYEALVSEWTNRDFYNLGFSGGACGEAAIVEYMANFDCSIFVIDYDYNAPTVDYLNATHLNIYLKFREVEKNKNIPIILISRPEFNLNPVDSDNRFNVILNTYNYAKSIGDENIYIIDGRTFFPEEIQEHCSQDKIHPNDLGFYYMAKAVYSVVREIEEKK